MGSTEPVQLSTTSVSAGGAIADDRGFEVLDKGVCWDAQGNPQLGPNCSTDNSEEQEFVITVEGLVPAQEYFFRAYVTTTEGTGYGEVLPFSTVVAPVYDIDGNGYDTVKIGFQTWLTSNLRVTRYNDGTEIPELRENADWDSMGFAGAYCAYENLDSNIAIFGLLYNHWTIQSGKNVCPSGYKVPSEADFSQLKAYLFPKAGLKLKEPGTAFWFSSGTANNSSGFSARGSGFRSEPVGLTGSTFSDQKLYAYFWTTTISSSIRANVFRLYAHDTDATILSGRFGHGNAIRCLKE